MLYICVSFGYSLNAPHTSELPNSICGGFEGHEVKHAQVSEVMGDRTQKRSGRTKKLRERTFDEPYEKAGGGLELELDMIKSAMAEPPIYWEISDVDVNTKYKSMIPRFLLEMLFRGIPGYLICSLFHAILQRVRFMARLISYSAMRPLSSKNVAYILDNHCRINALPSPAYRSTTAPLNLISYSRTIYMTWSIDRVFGLSVVVLLISKLDQ